MAVGDINSGEKGSGARYNDGKVNFSLLPLVTLEDEIRVWEYGAKKYAEWNWIKGMKWTVPFSCAMRHLSAWQAGEDLDPETGISHIAHAMCNLRMLTLYIKTFSEGDDREANGFLSEFLKLTRQAKSEKELENIESDIIKTAIKETNKNPRFRDLMGGER